MDVLTTAEGQEGRTIATGQPKLPAMSSGTKNRSHGLPPPAGPSYARGSTRSLPSSQRGSRTRCWLRLSGGRSYEPATSILSRACVRGPKRGGNPPPHRLGDRRRERIADLTVLGRLAA